MRLMRAVLTAGLLLTGCGGGGGGGGGANPPGGPPPPGTPGLPGTLDGTFGATTGKATTAFGSGDDQAWAVVIQSDGKIVAGGYSHNGSNRDFALARYNSDGTLDASFDTDGKVTTAIGSSDEAILALALQSDGKIVAAGYTVAGTDYNFALVRYNTNGSPDASFDGDGRVVTSAEDLYICRAVAIQADGKIVAGGYAIPGNTQFTVARYNADGSLDTNFAGDGIVKVTAGPDPPDICFSIAIQPDQKILAAGRAAVSSADIEFCVARLSSDGSLDTAFAGDGILHFTFPDSSFTDGAYAVGVTSAGQAVLAGSCDQNASYMDFGVGRCTAAGALDTTFDGDGMVISELGATYEEAFALAIQGDDKIVAAGYSNNNVNEDFAVMRYNSDGSLDTTFDLDGKLTLIFGTGDEQAHGVALQSDGRIVVVGYTWNGSDFDFAVARIWP